MYGECVVFGITTRVPGHDCGKQNQRQKSVYGVDINFTLNILRFPSFQSPLVLPDDLRTQFKNDLDSWLDRQIEHLEPMEVAHTQRLIDYLDVVKTPHSEAFDLPRLRSDFKNFTHRTMSEIRSGPQGLQ